MKHALDIEGFNTTTMESIQLAANMHAIEHLIVRRFTYIDAWPQYKNISAGSTIWLKLAEGVLSPFLWCIVVDSLLEKLN